MAFALFYFPQEKLGLFYLPCGCCCFFFKICVLHCIWEKRKLKIVIGLEIISLRGSATFITVALLAFPFKILAFPFKTADVKHQEIYVGRSEYTQWHPAACISFHKWCQAPLAHLCKEHLYLDKLNFSINLWVMLMLSISSCYQADLHTTVRLFGVYWVNQVHRFLGTYWENEVRYSCRTWHLISFHLHCSELWFWVYLCGKAQWVRKSMCQ